MVVPILIALLLIGCLIGFACYILSFIMVELLKAPIVVTKVIYLVGILVFIVVAVDKLSPITGFKLP